ncbi:hypothetical protein ACFSQT_29040, partial [Mesorhizobium calcicola]
RQRARRRASISGEQMLVGVNAHRPETDIEVDVLKIDNAESGAAIVEAAKPERHTRCRRRRERTRCVDPCGGGQ